MLHPCGAVAFATAPHLLYCAPRDCGAQLFIYRYIFAFFVIEYKEVKYER